MTVIRFCYRTGDGAAAGLGEALASDSDEAKPIILLFCCFLLSATSQLMFCNKILYNLLHKFNLFGAKYNKFCHKFIYEI